MNAKYRLRIKSSEFAALLQKVCEEMSIPYSANQVSQAFADISSSNPNLTDSELLTSLGRRASVRFRDIESNYRELIVAAYGNFPIVVPSKNSQAGKFNNYFVILRRHSRTKFVVLYEGREQIVPRRWIRKNAASNADGIYQWYLAQPMLAVESASSFDYQTGQQKQTPTPLRRLIAFLKPEASDIRTVFIFSLIVGVLSLTTPLAVEALVNTIAFGRYLQPLVILSLMVFIFLAFRAGLGILMAVVVEILQRRIFVRVVDDLSYRLTHVPVLFLKKKHGPELVNRFFDIVNVQKITSKLLLESTMLVLQTAIGMTVLAFYHPFLLGYDIGLLVLMTVVLYLFGRGAVKTAQRESQLKYDTAAWLQEIVRHPTTFKFNGGLGYAINRADELASNYIQERRRHFRILIRQITFSMLMQAVAATVLLGLGGYLVIAGQMNLGQLVAAELIVSAILGSFAKIGKDLESYYDLLAAIDKLGKLFDLPGEQNNKLQLAQPSGAAEIELVDVKLSQSRSTISQRVEAGSTTAIYGPSGSGKTTLMETIAGLQENSGYVTVNGFRVDLISAESLQSRLAYINDIEIFYGSVDDNLRMGRSEVGSESMNEIIEKLGLQKTVTGFEKGFNTMLSVTGDPLSTGQAIRLVLARALIARPAALLVDGLLDRLSDQDLDDVLTRLDSLKADTTMVISTGRKAIADWAETSIYVGAGD
jgi:putative ABC transport system ATP-binding protein